MTAQFPEVAEIGYGSIAPGFRTCCREIVELSNDLRDDIVEVPIADLRPADSPRLGELFAEHAQVLAEAEELLPIIVHRDSMRVVDGMHRVLAAQMAGRETIAVRFFTGGDDEAFLLAVDSNTAHGLPLTLTERRAAAARILKSRPHMSDRSVASITSLAARTVALIRCQSAGAADQQPAARIGRDGRVRPLDATNGRRIAAALVRSRPDISLRTIAREAGISVGTARDVRQRIRRGEDPTLGAEPGGKGHGTADLPAHRSARAAAEPIDPRLMLERLSRDPTLRYVESGRSVLRWLAPRVIASDDWEGVVREVPPHATFMLAKIARGCAAAWARFANELDQRAENPEEARTGASCGP